MTNKQLALIFLALSSTYELKAQINTNNFLNWFGQDKKTAKKLYEFNGLYLNYEEAQLTCVKSPPASMTCRMPQAQILFEKITISSRQSLPLLRLARKKAWSEQYSLTNQYVEEELITGLGMLASQRVVVYYLDNILWPVLIRAYDVVIDEHTCISITTKCDFRDWPAVEKTIRGIEASLSKKQLGF